MTLDNNKFKLKLSSTTRQKGSAKMPKFTVEQWRKVRGLTQKELADQIGMKSATYQTKEAGKTQWKADEIKDIAIVLNVSIENDLEY